MQIVERIKKLLALGSANSGATEAEAETAMSMATALMLKHNIDVQLDADGDDVGARQGEQLKYDEPWHHECATAVGYLYQCRVVIWRRAGVVSFVGRPDNLAAATEMMSYLCREVERLYKMNLVKGLSKIERANFRSTFKYACARRLGARAWAILEGLRRDDALAIAQTGSRALVIVASIDAQLAEADGILKGMGCKAIAVRPRKAGLGTSLGRAAGDSVQLQQRVS